jgi:hypothetical protein
MNYIVQIDDTPTFLTELRDGQPYGSPHPTRGIQMGFDAANEIVQRLRQGGYEACVADQYGQLPTAADLANVKRNVEYSVTFSGKYFMGQNGAGRDLGTDDPLMALRMNQEMALEVSKRLRRQGHATAKVVEVGAPLIDVQREVDKFFPSQ